MHCWHFCTCVYYVSPNKTYFENNNYNMGAMHIVCVSDNNKPHDSQTTMLSKSLQHMSVKCHWCCRVPAVPHTYTHKNNGEIHVLPTEDRSAKQINSSRSPGRIRPQHLYSDSRTLNPRVWPRCFYSFIDRMGYRLYVRRLDLLIRDIYHDHEYCNTNQYSWYFQYISWAGMVKHFCVSYIRTGKHITSDIEQNLKLMLVAISWKMYILYMVLRISSERCEFW